MKKYRLSKMGYAEIKEFYTTPYRNGGIQQKHAEYFREAVQSSPFLTENLNQAFRTFSADDTKQYIEGLRRETNADSNGSFHPYDRILYIQPELIAPEKGEAGYGSAVFVIAHETRHALDRMDKMDEKLITQFAEKAREEGWRDYTMAIMDANQEYRDAEARAEIDGFNAVVSMLKEKNPNPSLEEIFKSARDHMGDFIYINEDDFDNVTYTLRPNLVLNKDMYLAMDTPENIAKNIEGMGQNFYDKEGDFATDYPDMYAPGFIMKAVQEERKIHGENSKIYLQMDQLESIGIDESTLRQQLLKNYGMDFDSVITTSPPQMSIEQERAIQPEQPHRFDEPTHPFKAAALLAKYQSAIEAMDAGKPNPLLETARANPAVQKIMERFDAGLERRQMIREYEESRYSLANMPDRARDLHAQITDKLTAYVKENNLPYSREGLTNSITALTAEAFDQKMTKIDHIAINEGRLMVKQDGRFIHDFAEVDSFQSRLTPERDSFQNIVQSEQKHEHEEQQHEMERQMERSRSLVMGR
ncbi:hypothetical protein [Neisseria flavescens]|uniref:hypothetical protein n=1 Tax=Neisseria flavescens TaxID=484 RepID=UPI0007A5ED7B|nr:hypothetical protein [Neisseria flavescens]